MVRLALAVGLVTVATMLAAATGCGTSSADAGDGDMDGSAEAATVDANAQVVRASDYDQSCATDTDCLPVTEGNVCHPSAGQCPNAAISNGAYAQYQADVDKALTFCDDPSACGFLSPACCVGGKCQVGSQCSNGVPADAAADTGGDAAKDGGADASGE
jgi:hypothetical protein